MKKISLYWHILLSIVLFMALSCIIFLFPSACDWFVNHVHGYISGAVAHVSALVPFSVGEVLLVLEVLMGICSVLFLLFLIFLRKKRKYRKFCADWFKMVLMILACYGLLIIPTWLIPLRTHILGADRSTLRTDYSIQELTALRRYLVEQLNQAAEEIDISPEGAVRFYSDKEMQPLLEEAMKAYSEQYPRLSGYYPPVKCALLSDLYYQMNIGGMTHTEVAEPTYSKYEPPTYQPALRAHELSHVKGFIRENEANFISMLTLSESSDPLLRFSAYQDMDRYVFDQWDVDAYDLLQKMKARGEIQAPEFPQFHSGMTVEEKKALKATILEIRRIESEVFEIPEYSERTNQIQNAAEGIRKAVYEEDSHPIDENPKAQEAIQKTSQVYWDTYEEFMQENSYDGVVLLLLQYYDGKLY